MGAAAAHLRRGAAPSPARAPEPSGPVSTPIAGPGETAEPPPVLAPPLSDRPLTRDRGRRPARGERRRCRPGDRDRLSDRLRARGPITAEDLQAAEDLFGRYPVPARDLLEGVLIGAAEGHREGRRYDAAAAVLERARVVAPSSPRVPKALLALWLETGDWTSAESAARELAARAPSDPEAARGLAYALVRQDRSREAIDVLVAFLDRHPDAETRALLERFQRDHGSEGSLDEARLAHFHVRYDGDAHEEVGREILRVLDRHYATLVRTFSHQPAAPIPVILLSRESYYDATGAPAWSGGQYDDFDGRVRLPIGGLTHLAHGRARRHAAARADARLHRGPLARLGTARAPRGPGPVHGGQALPGAAG